MHHQFGDITDNLIIYGHMGVSLPTVSLSIYFLDEAFIHIYLATAS